MAKRMYRQHSVSLDEILKLLDEGHPILEMVQKTGKHNTWIKEKLIDYYGHRIEFKQGRGGGIFVDGIKKTKD